jgi:hypothetical protein
VTNLSIEEARAQLEEQLRPQTDWPEPTEVNEQMEAAEKDAMAEFERLDREDRESTSGL